MNADILKSEVQSASVALATVIRSAEVMGQAIDPNVKQQLFMVNQMLDEIVFELQKEEQNEQS